MTLRDAIRVRDSLNWVRPSVVSGSVICLEDGLRRLPRLLLIGAPMHLLLASGEAQGGHAHRGGPGRFVAPRLEPASIQLPDAQRGARMPRMRTLRFSSSVALSPSVAIGCGGKAIEYLGDSGSGSSGGSSSGTGPVGPTLPLLEGRMRATVTLLSLLLGGCSPTSSGGGSPESADAAVAQACAYLQTAAGNASHSGMCPIAPGGTCLGTSGCDPKSLPTGLACSDQYCIALIDPCVPLGLNEHMDFWACTCVGGHWDCGLCGEGASTCIEAGAIDAEASTPR